MAIVIKLPKDGDADVYEVRVRGQHRIVRVSGLVAGTDLAETEKWAQINAAIDDMTQESSASCRSDIAESC